LRENVIETIDKDTFKGLTKLWSVSLSDNKLKFNNEIELTLENDYVHVYESSLRLD